MSQFNLPQDFRDFFDVLRKHEVQFAVAGAYAMAAWGYIRVTGDIDILVLPLPENAKRLYAALVEFGAPLKGISEQDFSKPDLVYQLGRAPIRIDILTSLSGVSLTTDLMKISSLSNKFGFPTPVLSLDVLIENKRATGRPKDLADVSELEKILHGRK